MPQNIRRGDRDQDFAVALRLRLGSVASLPDRPRRVLMQKTKMRPHASARVLQRDLFLGQTQDYRDALARDETMRPTVKHG